MAPRREAKGPTTSSKQEKCRSHDWHLAFIWFNAGTDCRIVDQRSSILDLTRYRNQRPRQSRPRSSFHGLDEHFNS